jgi:hypothetical protein
MRTSTNLTSTKVNEASNDLKVCGTRLVTSRK